MAMAYPLDTPDRVLKRVQQLEDMELPSLPSFQHDDIDYDSMSNPESSRGDYKQSQESFEHDISQDDLATPHPLRQAIVPPSSSTLTGGTARSTDSFSTASGSPFPPLASTREGTPSPYAPATALTSTPQSKFGGSLSRSMGRSTSDYTATAGSRPSRHERTRSGTGSIGSSTQTTRRERWQTPGEMSRSFSGEHIMEGIDMGSELSVPLNDQSHSQLLQQQYDHLHSQTLPELPSLTDVPGETPIPQRLSSANTINFDRPRKRGASAAMHQLEIMSEDSSDPSTPMTPKTAETELSVTSALHVPHGDRIPSLSRSEVSVTDTSGAATTPEGPNRNVSMIIPRPDAHQEYEVTGEYQYENNSHNDEDHGENPTMEYHEEYEYTPQDDEESGASHQLYASPAKTIGAPSPTKLAYTPSVASYQTPGTLRGRQSQEITYDSIANPSTVLHDITNSVQSSSSAPFTPTPAGVFYGKQEEVTTPRAPLNDAERRKSHILAVLGSSGLPSRRLRPSVRGTPHPLRRVSTAPDTESIIEEGSDIGRSQRSMRFGSTPRSFSRLTADQSGNESFVSVASSADLTSDKRASHTHSRLSRGNTSFPTILLPTNPSTPGGGSLKGLSDQRADGIKIQKHLNAMNKQLLETNADLAREAEAWRDEVDRLRDILHEHGIEVEDVDVMAEANIQSTSANLSQRLPDWPIASPSGRNSTEGDHSKLISQLSSLSTLKSLSPDTKHSATAQDLLEGLSPEEHAAVMQEMAERLEVLEQGLNEKDQIVADLEEQLAAVRAKSDGALPDQSSVEEIQELRQQLEQAEQARIASHAEFSQKTEQHAKRFGEICSGFEDQVKELERELSAARADAERLRSERTRWDTLASFDAGTGPDGELKKRNQELEIELDIVKDNLRKRTTEVENLKEHSARVVAEKEGLMLRIERTETEVATLENKISSLANRESHDADSQDSQAMKAELKAACEAQTAAEDQFARLQKEVEAARRTTSRQESEIEELAQVITDLEADLQAAQDASRTYEHAEEELRAVQQELQAVNDKLADKESEIEVLIGRLDVANIATQALRTSQRRSISPTSPTTSSTKISGQNDTSENHLKVDSHLISAMEERLDEAYREIGRLKHEIGATPQRKSAIEVRDARIQALEREKAALADRLAFAKSSASASPPMPGGVQHADSPFKRATPFVHRAIASLKTPKTPGPMRELSWLQTTIGDANEPVLQAQLEYLQHELADANHQLDSNFSRLESAGLGAVALAEKLAAAEERIGELEDEIRTLIQRNKASLALVSAQREERERDAEGRMEKALHAVHQQMEELKSDIAAERSRLQRDNSRLQDLVSDMTLKSKAESESFRAEVERIADEAETNLKVIQDEVDQVTREKDDLERSLQAYRTQISQLERELADERRAYDSLSRRNALATQSAASQAELARKNDIAATLQTELDGARSEADRLERLLSQRSRSLQETEARLDQMRTERERVMSELEEFERDLRTQRQESKAFGGQLQALKREQMNAAQIHQAELKGLERELRDARDRERKTANDLAGVQSRFEQVERWRSEHQCHSDMADVLADQKARFKTQSRELATQIRYLKAKYTRESTFRNALSLQKRYLLLLVGGMSLDQQATLKAIASMGYPAPGPVKKRKSLKSVGLAVLSIIRARNTAQQWRAEVELKSSAVAAHGERRRVSART